MAKKKMSRKELLKGPDEFMTLSTQFLEYFKSHEQAFKVGGIALVVVAVIYGACHLWFASIDTAGQNAYNTAVQHLEKIEPKTDSLQDIKRLETRFTEIIENYGMSRAAFLALPQIARINSLQKDYGAAVSQYNEFLDEISGNTLYQTLTTLALAACLEAKGNINAAVETLTPLAETENNSAFKPVAMWHLARVYRLKGDPETSREIMQALVENHAGSAFYAMARARL